MNKKGMEWAEIGKWIIILILLVVILFAVITPVREALFAKLEELVNFIG